MTGIRIIPARHQHIVCPQCGAEDQFQWGHLSPGQTFGPWWCDHCGFGLEGRVNGAGLPDAWPVTSQSASPGFILLKMTVRSQGDVFFVLRKLVFREPNDDDHDVDVYQRYYFEEHTCPTNFVPVEAVLEDQDADPHGVFEYVAWRPVPADWPESPTYADWSGLFAELPQGVTIEGTVVDRKKLN